MDRKSLQTKISSYIRRLKAKAYSKSFFLFLLIFLASFLYFLDMEINNTGLAVFIYAVFLLIFLISLYKIKISLYLFIFLVPLLNTVTTILSIRPVPMLLLFFVSLFMGFYVDSVSRSLSDNTMLSSKIKFETEIFKPVTIFIIIFAISSIITIWRLANFFPLITKNYYNLKVNVAGALSTDSIYMIKNTFMEYLVAFGLLLIIFNVIKNKKDFLVSSIVLISSAVLSSFMALYQYLINPYVGSFSYWVDSGRLNATFTDPNSLGGYTILLFPIFVSLILYFKKWFIKLIIGVFLVLFLFMTFLSGSRTALIGIFFSILLFLIFGAVRFFRFIYSKIKSISLVKKIIIPIAAVLILLILIITPTVFLYQSYTNEDSMVHNIGIFRRTFSTLETFVHYYRQSGFLESIKSISNYRYFYWWQAVQMFNDHPVTGVGQGAYTIELPNYFVKNRTGLDKIDYTGNYYLQILSELGIVGIILILFIFFMVLKKSLVCLKKDSKNRSRLIFMGFIISFASMLVGQILGPHTNFIEIQFIFWAIIGIMIAYVRFSESREENLKYNGNAGAGENINNNTSIRTSISKSRFSILSISNKLNFKLAERIGAAVIIIIFTILLSVSAITDLSINVQQNLLDKKNNYRGWENVYGFYNAESYQDMKMRWMGSDASEVIDKESSAMVIPMRDTIPSEYYTPLYVKIFVDNYLVKRVKLDYDTWQEVEIKIPEFASDKFTLTLSLSRTWVPRDVNLNMDTRELGVMVGEYQFK